MVLIDIYESYFGIYNHLDSSRTGDKTRPMASVALHECEDISSSSDLYKVIDNYFEKEVLKHTGYKLDEFLNLPREYTEIIFKKISEIQLKETKKANEVNNMLSATAQRKN